MQSRQETNSFAGIIKTVVENGPARNLLNFFQEENNRVREHEMRMMQLFMSSSKAIDPKPAVMHVFHVSIPTRYYKRGI